MLVLGCLLGSSTLGVAPAAAQLQTLSQGNTDQQWRDAQLQVFDRQLADTGLPDELRQELTAQRKWLAAWNPKNAAGALQGGTATDQVAKTPAEESSTGQPAEDHRLIEPTLDPQGLASELRERLFDAKQRPTTNDTAALQSALVEHPDDLGLRQLQMHWIDQGKYRDEYWKEIADSCSRVAALIRDSAASQENDVARPKDDVQAKDGDTEKMDVAAAFAYYRKARALAYCLAGRPRFKTKITGADRLTNADREQMQNAIGQCKEQIDALVGAGQAEFFQLDLYVLRRDGWKGRALELLERHAERLDKPTYLRLRYELLGALGWTKPAAQIAALLATGTPVGDPKPVLEIEFIPVPVSAGAPEP